MAMRRVRGRTATMRPRVGPRPRGGARKSPIPCEKLSADVAKWSSFGRNEPRAQRVAHQPRHVADAKALHDLRAVRLHRLHREVEQEGDLLGALAPGDELQDLPLAS